jgi:hypothetical protein
MRLSFFHHARVAAKRYLPDKGLGIAGWAKVSYKTRLFSRPRELRRRWASRVRAAGGGQIALDEFEYRVLSQNGEDGLLEAIFQVIGFTTRSILEFGFGGTESNFLNLALSHDLDAYFMDGVADNCRRATATYRVMGRGRLRVSQAFITAENINEVIPGIGLRGEIDAVSIDVDGNDYWLWQALEVVNPRLIVIEYNAQLGPHASVTIAYDPLFNCGRSAHEIYQGASLAALVTLAGRKGYRLIGCESSGTNAFFLRADIDAPSLPTRNAVDAFRYRNRLRAAGLAEQDREALIARLPFVQI